MFTMDHFMTTYDTEIADLTIGGRPFRFHVPRTIAPFINPEDPLRDFPLWSKIWEASLLLAHQMAARPVRRGERFIEVGAGLGVVGLVAAAFGHQIIISENDRNALAFIDANRLENNCTNARVCRLDWNRLDLEAQFDVILGSELIYRESDFAAIRTLFQTLLKPGGEVLLAGEIRQTNRAFFDRMQSRFDIQIAKHTLRSESQATPLLLIRMVSKGHR